mgnify:CR=1 FL=1
MGVDPWSLASGGVSPIVERFLKPNFVGALEVKEGFVFFRVIAARVMSYQIPLVDSNGDEVTLSASSSLSETYILDPRNPNRDCLYIDAALSPGGWPWFLHGSIGIKPELVWMYPRYPSGKTIPGKLPNLDPIRPGSGDSMGYVDSRKSPFENPTDWVEYVILPYYRIGFEFYNKDPDFSHKPRLHLLFSLYHVQMLNPDSHSTLIGRIARREIPAAFLRHGWADTPEELGRTLISEWNAAPLSLDEAAELR